MALKEMVTLSREVTLSKLIEVLSEKRFTLKGKKLLPSFRVNIFSERIWQARKQIERHKICFPCKTCEYLTSL